MLHILDQLSSKFVAIASLAVIIQFPGSLVTCITFILFNLTDDFKYLMHFGIVRYHMP